MTDTSSVTTQRVPIPEVVAPTPQARHARDRGADNRKADSDRADIDRADYSVAVRLDGGPAATPEQWARGCLEGAPVGVRQGLVFGWRHVLRLRLGPLTASGTVLGWYLVESSPEVATVSAGSPLLECQHHFVRDGDGIIWVTIVRTHTRAGRVLWRAIAPTHELSMPLLLKRAAARIS